MSWQEELRRLDDQLSQGHLTYQQYRVRRDDVLAEAATAPAKRPVLRARKPAKNEWKPRTRRRPQSAAELLAWNPPATASPADECPTERIAPPPRPAERTHPSLPTIPVPPLASPGPTPPAAPRRIHPTENTIPWLIHETRRGRSPWLLVTLAVFVLLAVIIGAMWWIGTQYNDAPSGTTSVTDGIPRPAELPLVDRLPVLPGLRNPQSSAVSVARGAELKLYEVDTARALQKHRVGEVTWKGSTDGATVYTVLVSKAPDTETARALTAELAALSEPALSRFEVAGDRAGLIRFRRMSTESNSLRVLYTAGARAVRVDVRQQAAGKVSDLEAGLSTVLDDLTAVLPPN